MLTCKLNKINFPIKECRLDRGDCLPPVTFEHPEETREDLCLRDLSVKSTSVPCSAATGSATART